MSLSEACYSGRCGGCCLRSILELEKHPLVAAAREIAERIDITTLPPASASAARLVIDLAAISSEGPSVVEAVPELVIRALERGAPLTEDELAQPTSRFITMPVSMEDIWAQAEDLARHLSPLLVSGGTLLDVGGGMGGYTAAVLGSAPRARAVLFDVPSIANTARRFLHGFGSRASVREIDLLGESLPQLGGRVALVADVLHVLPPDATPRLLREIFAALQPGGQIIIVEIDAESLRGRLFRLVAWLRGAGVRLHSEAALASELRAAGFEAITRLPSKAPWEPLVLAGAKGQGVDIFGID